MAENQQAIAEFEKARSQLMAVTAQKRNMQAQSGIINATIEELEKTKEKTVYKAIGNILVPSDAKAVLKDARQQKESIDLRLKTVQKQEDTLIDKLNKLRAQIEGKPEPKKESKESKEEGA